jgi:two-component system cell cycle sensor histidine kinase/response regulator CckA
VAVTARAFSKAQPKEAAAAANPPAAGAGAPVILFALDRNGLFTACDGRGFESRGVGAGNVVGRSAADVLRDVSVVEPSGRVMSGAEAVQRSVAGETIHGKCELAEEAFDLRLLPHLERESGQVAGVVGVATEVTERARAEKSLRALLEVMPDLVFVHRKGRLLYVNPAAHSALGSGDSEAVVGRMFLDLIHPDDRDAIGAHDRFAGGEAGEPGKTRRVRLLRKDGDIRTIEKLSIPILFNGALATASIASDVTDRDDAHEKLLRADRLAAIGTLAAGAAHEINNPLTYAMINAEHVLRQLRMVAAEGHPAANGSEVSSLLPPLLDSLVQAVDGMTRIREIVRNLMTFSQSTVEAHALVDVRSVVESSIQMALHEIVHRARLVRDMAEVPPIEANEARLGQVFLNLIVNAAQAIPEGDTRKHEVRVATYTDDAGNAVIEVGDTGVGIAPEMLPRIFDPFFTSKGPGQGVGLGLSISLGTVKSLGGDIQVASDPQQGTVFRVILPSAKDWRTAHPAPPSDAVMAEHKRVLVVDDDRRVGAALERALSGLSNVEATTDARTVLDRLASGERWDVILCDLMMPETSGMDLYREALRIAPDAAKCIVFMTAGAFTSNARAFLDGVRNPCLEKPIDLGQLRSLIARAGRWQRPN